MQSALLDISDLSILGFMLGFFNIQTPSREAVIYGVTRWAPLHQTPRQSSTDPHHYPVSKSSVQKNAYFTLPWGFVQPSSVFSYLSCRTPRREPERACGRAGGKGRASPRSEWEHYHGFHEKEKVYFKGYSLGIEGFEEMVKEVLILALYLGELNCQKYFLGKQVPVPGPQTGSRGTGKAEHKWEQWENPSRSKQGSQKAIGMLPVQEGYEMHRGKGTELLRFHNRWAEPTSEQDWALLYLPQALTLLERSQELWGAIAGILPF